MIQQLRTYEIFEKNKAAFHARFRDHAARIMQAGQPTIAALGPIGKLESHEHFARRFGAGALPHAAE